MTSLRNYRPEMAAHPSVVLHETVERCIAEGAPVIVEIPAVTPASVPDEIVGDSPAEIVEHALADAGPLPYNAVTGIAYRGGNIMRLLTVEVERGYGSGGWAGFGQWKSAGRCVRKGEHGTACIMVVDIHADDDRDSVIGRKPRGFRVFHYDQTEALPKEGE